MSTALTVRHLRPGSLGDALVARSLHPDWLVLAGGTDLMADGLEAPPPGVLDLFGLRELTGVAAHGETITVGPATTYAGLLASPVVARRLPVLEAAVRGIGGVQLRERGTIGGNVMTSSPVGDTLPCLLVLDAVVIVASLRGVRRLPYEGFCTGYRTTALEPDELLVAIDVSPPPPGSVQRWRKVGTHAAHGIGKLAAAFVAHVEDGRVARARIALGGVADRPVRLHAVEELLAGRAPGAELARETRAAVLGAVTPIDDLRSTAEYRRATAAALVARFVADLAQVAR